MWTGVTHPFLSVQVAACSQNPSRAKLPRYIFRSLTQSLSSIDIFIFALQLEYLEADFYYWAVKVRRLSPYATKSGEQATAEGRHGLHPSADQKPRLVHTNAGLSVIEYK